MHGSAGRRPHNRTTEQAHHELLERKNSGPGGSSPRHRARWQAKLRPSKQDRVEISCPNFSPLKQDKVCAWSPAGLASPRLRISRPTLIVFTCLYTLILIAKLYWARARQVRPLRGALAATDSNCLCESMETQNPSNSKKFISKPCTLKASPP